jgi:hypothetical protein
VIGLVPCHVFAVLLDAEKINSSWLASLINSRNFVACTMPVSTRNSSQKTVSSALFDYNTQFQNIQLLNVLCLQLCNLRRLRLMI